MRLLTTVAASACILGMAGGAAVTAHAQPYPYPPHPYYHHHHWRARQAWRWRHPYVAPPVVPGPYAYYAPPPVYYPPPGVSLGVTIP